MLGELRTIDNLDVEGRRVLLRADFSVPLTQASARAPVRVADDTRIQGPLATIQELRLRGARLVLVSHLDRPEGHDPALSTSMQITAPSVAPTMGMRSVTRKASGTANGTPSAVSAANAARPATMEIRMFPIT